MCLFFLTLCIFSLSASSSARGFKTAELQIPGRAQSVEGAEQLRKPANRRPLQGNVSTEDN